MTDVNPETGEIMEEGKVCIPTPDGVKIISEEALAQYKADAFEHLEDEDVAKGNFKDLMETIEDVTGIPKGVMTKYFKASYKAKTKEAQALAKAFEALDDALA